MSVGRSLLPGAYYSGAFLIAAVHSVSFKVNRKANVEADGAEGCKDSGNREQNIKLA